MSSEYVDFAVITIFSREVLEGSIIIGEYRTIILRPDDWSSSDFTRKDALRTITWSAFIATILAIVVCAAVAIPLALLSNDFDDRTSKTIEGVSKIVAAICLLQLSLKLPKWLGVYASKKEISESLGATNDTASGSAENVDEGSDHASGLTRRSIVFNVSWNIWREVAECGVFLIPFFLSGEGVRAIPLSAVIGSVTGLALGVGIYYANKRLKNKTWLAVFMGSLLLLLSTGLFSGGCHNLEKVLGMTHVVWTLDGDFWSVDKLPMTVFKPFGYSDYRTVLQIVTFWGWLLLGCMLHYRKWRQSRLARSANQTVAQAAIPKETLSAVDDEAEAKRDDVTPLEFDDVEDPMD